MKFIYPAVVKKIEENRYYASFPDLKDCEAYGDSIDEVMDNANAAAYTWIETELDDEEGQLPPVSDKEDISLNEGEFVRNVCVTMRFFEGWDE